MATPAPSATLIATSVVPTKIYINEVPEYSLLLSCAERKVSSVVRLMISGCGDGSRTTSYACFCYSSSTFYDNLIGNEIQTTCSDLAQVTSAHVVFQKYCAMGQTRGVLPSNVTASTTSLSISTSTISTTSTSVPSSSVVSPSSATISPATSNANSSQRTTKIAVGVVVPIVVLVAILAAFFIYRVRKRRRDNVEAPAYSGDAVGELPGQVSSELPAEKYRHELPSTKAQTTTAELP